MFRGCQNLLCGIFMRIMISLGLVHNDQRRRHFLKIKRSPLLPIYSPHRNMPLSSLYIDEDSI